MTTNETLIFNYLEKNYTPKLDSSGVIFIDKVTGKAEYKNDLVFTINKIFDVWIDDSGQTTYTFFQAWVDAKTEPLIGPINNYLKGCYVRFAHTGWVVYNSDRKIITIEDVLKLFLDKYTKEFLTHYYGEWYSDTVCVESARIMNTY